jgi:hypothetical protein
MPKQFSTADERGFFFDAKSQRSKVNREKHACRADFAAHAALHTVAIITTNHAILNAPSHAKILPERDRVGNNSSNRMPGRTDKAAALP